VLGLNPKSRVPLAYCTAVRIRWQFAQITSHFNVKAFSGAWEFDAHLSRAASRKSDYEHWISLDQVLAQVRDPGDAVVMSRLTDGLGHAAFVDLMPGR